VARLLVYGDSLTAGFPENVPYARELSQSLAAVGVYVDIFGCGLSGLTAVQLASDIDSTCLRDITGRTGFGLRKIINDQGPFDLVLIMAGTNDVGFGTPAEDIIASLKQLHETCHAARTPTVALSIPDCRTTTPGVPGNRSRVNKALADWVNSRSSSDVGVVRTFFVDTNVQLLPYTSMSQSQGLWHPDGIHFTAAGSRKFGKQLSSVILKSGALLASGPLRPRSLSPDFSDTDLPKVSFFKSSENKISGQQAMSPLGPHSFIDLQQYKSRVVRQSSMDSQLDGMTPRSRVFLEEYEPLVLTTLGSATTPLRTTKGVKGVMKQSKEARPMSPPLSRPSGRRVGWQVAQNTSNATSRGLRSLSLDSMRSTVTFADDLAEEKENYDGLGEHATSNPLYPKDMLFPEISWPITVSDTFPAKWTSHPVPTSFSKNMQSLPWKGVKLNQSGPRKSTTSPFLGSGSVTIHSHHATKPSMSTHKSLGVVCGHPTATVSPSCGGVLTKRTISRGGRDCHKVGGVGMPFKNTIRRV
jgi:lysophospholipase L1-like esterase